MTIIRDLIMRKPKYDGTQAESQENSTTLNRRTIGVVFNVPTE